MIIHNVKITEMKYKLNSGLSIVEILIAIVILAIGLLGVAGLQVAGMRNNNSANLRTTATMLASEYSDILRSNLNQVNADTFKDPDDDGTDGFISNSLGAVTANNSCIDANVGCDAKTMALNDLFNWITNIQTLLPGGIASTSQAAGIYTVSISWIDDRANTDSNAAGAGVVAGAGVDVNGDGDDIDDIDTDDDGVNDANENHFKQFATSFQP